MSNSILVSDGPDQSQMTELMSSLYVPYTLGLLNIAQSGQG